MSRIRTILIRIRILLFTLIRIRTRLFDTDPDPYCFEELMYIKQYTFYLFIHLNVIFLVSRSARTQQAGTHFFPFQLIFMCSLEKDADADPRTLGNESRKMIRIRTYPDPQHCFPILRAKHSAQIYRRVGGRLGEKIQDKGILANFHLNPPSQHQLWLSVG